MASCCTAGVAASNAPMMDPLVADVATGRSRRPRRLISVVRLGIERPTNLQNASRSRWSGAIVRTCSEVRLFIWSMLRTPWSTSLGAKCVRSAALRRAKTSLKLVMARLSTL